MPVLPLFVLDPRPVGAGGTSRQAYLGDSLRALDASDRRRLQVVRGDPVRRVAAGGPRGGRRPGSTSPPTSAPTAPRGTCGRAALAEHDIELVRTGSPYAVAPGRVTKRRRVAVRRVHAVPQGVGRAHGWRAPVDRAAAASAGSPSTDTTDIPDRALPDGLVAARRRRGGGAPTLADVPRRADRPTTAATATSPASRAPRG